MVPLLEKVVSSQSLKERVLDVPPQHCITKDNVKISVDAVIYWQLVDHFKSYYAVVSMGDALVNLVLTQIRSEVGLMDLDQTFSARQAINDRLSQELDVATDPWGIKVTRVELRDILPSAGVVDAMETQMTAERRKRATILDSEGEQEAAINVARGRAEALVLDAEARSRAVVIDAEATAQQQKLLAEARAQAAATLAEVLQQQPAAATHSSRGVAVAVGQGLDGHGRAAGPRQGRQRADGGSPEPLVLAGRFAGFAEAVLSRNPAGS